MSDTEKKEAYGTLSKFKYMQDSTTISHLNDELHHNLTNELQ